MKAVICLCLLVVLVKAQSQQNDASYDGQHDAKLDENGKPVHLTAKMQSPKGEMSLEDNQEYATQNGLLSKCLKPECTCKRDGVHKRIKRAVRECRIVGRGRKRKRICRRIGISQLSKVGRPHGGGGIAV